MVACEPFEQILDIHEAYLANLARANSGTGVADHRVTGIDVRDCEERVVRCRQSLKLSSLIGRFDEGLVADDRDARLEKKLAWLEMQMIGRNDDCYVDGVVSRSFGRCHFAEVEVVPLRRYPYSFSGCQAGVRLGGNDACDEL